MTPPYDTDHSNWLTIEQAVHAYHLSERTIRRRLSTGELAAEKIDTPYGKAWRIRPPQERATGDTAAPAPDNSQVALIPLDKMREVLAPLQQALDHLQGERDDLRRQLDEVQAARLVDKEEIGRLRGRLEAVDSTPDPAESTAQPEPGRRRWFWQR
jgi:hypothetical protein